MGLGLVATMVLGCGVGAAPPADPTAPGGGPFLSVTPLTLSFGNVPVGMSTTRDVTLSNTGTADAHITKLTVTGSGFSATGLPVPLTLGRGTSRTLTVGFAPPQVGPFAGDVTVESDAADVVVIAPTGTGVTSGSPPAASIDSVTINPATVTAGQTVQMTAAVAATGAIDKSLTWSVPGGSLGSIDAATGAYTAPSTAGNYTVTATSVADSTKSGSGTVTVTATAPASPKTDFFVALTGNDSNPGTVDQPFATLERARAAVRDLKTSSGLPAGGVTVWLGAGMNSRTAAFTLTAEDSGTSTQPITYRSIDARNPATITGGRAITGWTLMTAGNAPAGAWARTNAAAQGHIYFAQAPSFSYGSLVGRGEDWGGQMVPNNAGPFSELVYDGAVMQLGRWPNRNPADRKSEFWTMSADGVPAPNGGKALSNASVATSSFPYAGTARPTTWGNAVALAAANRPYVSHFEFQGWVWGLRQMSAVTSTDITTTSLARRVEDNSLASPIYGLAAGQQWYATNLLEEVDSAGEYWLDRVSGAIYFWPPSDGATGKATLSGTPTVLAVSGAAYVTFQDIVFGEAQQDLVKTDAASSHITFTGCTFRNAAGSLVWLDGTAQTIDRSTLTGAGDAGILLLASSSTVANTEITDWGRYMLAYAGAINPIGDGNAIRGNRIHGGPHSALYVGSKPSTGDNYLVELNDISQTNLYGCDGGALYFRSSGAGWEIRYNYFHDIPQCVGANPYTNLGGAIYSDDYSATLKIHGNLFYRLGAQSVPASGGNGAKGGGLGTNLSAIYSKAASAIQNNLFVKCDYALSEQYVCPAAFSNNQNYLASNQQANQTGLNLADSCSLGSNTGFASGGVDPGFVDEPGGNLATNATSGNVELNAFGAPPAGSAPGTYAVGGKEVIPFSRIGIH
jgi:hypothetical protein